MLCIGEATLLQGEVKFCFALVLRSAVRFCLHWHCVVL